MTEIVASQALEFCFFSENGIAIYFSEGKEGPGRLIEIPRNRG